MVDQCGNVTAIERSVFLPLSRADEVDRIGALLIGTADEIDVNAIVAGPVAVATHEACVAEPLVREDAFDRSADDRLDRATTECRPLLTDALEWRGSG